MENKNSINPQETPNKCRLCFERFADEEKLTSVSKEIEKDFLEFTNIEVRK